jgi:hypothetical protein
MITQYYLSHYSIEEDIIILLHIISEKYEVDIQHISKIIDLLVHYLVYDEQFNHHYNKSYIITTFLHNFFSVKIQEKERKHIIHSYSIYIDNLLTKTIKHKKDTESQK